MIRQNSTLPTPRCHVKFCWQNVFDDSAKQRIGTNNGFKSENKHAAVILLTLTNESAILIVHFNIHTKYIPANASQGFNQLFIAGECYHLIVTICWQRKTN